MPGSPIRVEGLDDMRKALRAIDKNLGKGLRTALNTASSFLISKAQPLIPRKSGKAAASLKARSSQNLVRIAVGGKKAPYYPWLDYGGNVGVNDSAHRPFLKDGRYLYPTLSLYRADFDTILSDSLDDVARDAGLDVD